MIEETKLKSVEKVITKEMVINYANTSGDQNPIHIDEEYAKNTDFKGTIVHGMFLISSISEMLIKNIGLNKHYESFLANIQKLKESNSLKK